MRMLQKIQSKWDKKRKKEQKVLNDIFNVYDYLFKLIVNDPDIGQDNEFEVKKYISYKGTFHILLKYKDQTISIDLIKCNKCIDCHIYHTSAKDGSKDWKYILSGKISKRKWILWLWYHWQFKYSMSQFIYEHFG